MPDWWGSPGSDVGETVPKRQRRQVRTDSDDGEVPTGAATASTHTSGTARQKCRNKRSRGGSFAAGQDAKAMCKEDSRKEVDAQAAEMTETVEGRWKVGALHEQQDLPGFNVHHLVLVKTAAPALSTSTLT